MLTGKPEDAESELNIVLKKQPFDPDALNYMINLEITSANYKKALDYIDKALKVQPGSKELLIKKIAVLEKSAQIKAAYIIADSLSEKHRQSVSV